MLKQDSNGRQLYVNHRSRQASLRRPRAQRLQRHQDRQEATSTQQQGGGLDPVGGETSGVGGEQFQRDNSGGSQEIDQLFGRQFLGRSHSVDVMMDQPGQLEDSMSEQSPPNAEEVSILQPFAALSLADQNASLGPQQHSITHGATGSGGGATSQSYGAAVPSTSQGASYAPPQLTTALQRAVSTLYKCPCPVCLVMDVHVCVLILCDLHYSVYICNTMRSSGPHERWCETKVKVKVKVLRFV